MLDPQPYLGELRFRSTQETTSENEEGFYTVQSAEKFLKTEEGQKFMREVVEPDLREAGLL